MLEAFASGVPVIASDLASIREWIIPGVTGLIVPARDVNALADAIVQLLQRQNLSERIAAEARKLVEKRADHTREMQRMESLYRSLIG
jgi:glycosyltransferase involved in cell wall biosynthesis